jgi:hypothetical protein
MQHLGGHDRQVRLFEAAIDLTHKVRGDGIWFDNGKRAFDSHS